MPEKPNAQNVLWPLTKLVPWEKNPRAIDKKDFERLKKQLTKHKQYKPLLINQDGVILGGNMRYQAMKDLGYDEAWVSVVDAKTEKEMIEYALSDNDRAGFYQEDRLAELVMDADIDFDAYKVDLGQLTDLKTLLDKFGPEPTEDDFDVEEALPEEPMSQRGDIYQLGKHRLMCGDATDFGDVSELMNNQLADMVFTDPPYNTGMTGEGQGSKTLWKGYEKKADSTRLSHMFNDSYTPEQWEKFLTDVFANYYAATKGEAAFYVCIDWRKVHDIRRHLEAHMPVSNVIVWDKMVHGLGSDYKYTYELIVVAKKGNPKIQNRIGTDYQDIWHVQRKIGRNDDHATAKPIELCMKPIKHASKQDDIVLDLFGGSGSTLIACEQTQRTCYMIELDPRYVDVIIARWEKFTGEKAVKL